MKVKIITILIMTLFIIASIIPTISGLVLSRTYTTDADFDEGILINVEHETVHDQLQLSNDIEILPFIWVPNNGQGTVSKVNTNTGKELARYRVAPHSNCDPSRTTVDLEGNCWVGCRDAGTVVKIGLFEAGNWIDRNNDSIPQTSQDLNNDGDITGAELLPFGQDECVLYEVLLRPGYMGTFTPGTIPSTSYDYGHWSTSPRGLAIDASNNLWAGTWNPCKYHYIDGETAAILKTVDLKDVHQAYGAVIDSNGVLWSSSTTLNHVMRMDPSSNPPTVSYVDLGHFVYGIGLDFSNHLFASGFQSMKLSKVNITTATKEWTKIGPFQGRGVACTTDNDIWVASTLFDKVYRYANDGTLKNKIYVGDGPTGVAVDSNGKVWACNRNDNTISRIDPTTNTVDMTKSILGSGGHYTYSDMTGMIAQSITTKIGTWTVVFDSEELNTSWGKVSWTSYEPAGTSVTVKVRSNRQSTPSTPSHWSSWESASNGVDLSSTPDGRYLQIETTLQITSGDESPILYDLTVEVGNQPPVADFTWIPLEPEPGETVTFDASSSYDLDGNIILFEWDWDNDDIYDESHTSPTATHTWNQEGSYPVTLRVTDDDGATDTYTATVNIVSGNQPPVADAGGPYSGDVGENITFNGSGSYDPDGSIVGYRWDWTNDGIYDTNWSSSPIATHSYDSPEIYTVKLQVKDNDGATDTDTATVNTNNYCENGEKPCALIMQYTGEDCSASNHYQDPNEVSCNGDPAYESPVHILATNKADPEDPNAEIWFDGLVDLNESFEINATNAGYTKLSSNTHIHIFNATNDTFLQHIKFHTSCSQPLFEGDQFGSLKLIDFTPQSECSNCGLEVLIDIKPSSYPNNIKPSSYPNNIKPNSIENIPVAILATGNHQNVLWDNGPRTCDGYGSTKGEKTTFGKYWLEVADDFIVGPKTWTVNNGHFEGLCFDKNLQVDSILVRFFNDTGDLPANNHFYEKYSTDFTLIDSYDSCGYYHTVIDVNFDNVVLLPGRYWVQFTPVGCDGDWHYQARTNQHYGADLAHRDGDPTGGYTGDYGSYTWIHFVYGFDMCFKLTGHAGDPPTAPTITGPNRGFPLIPYSFTFTSTDPDGDNVSYYIEWGDGKTSGWTPYFPSGTPGYSKSHSWIELGSYIIRAKANDTEGLESLWSEHKINIPRSKTKQNTMFLQLLKNYPNLFPILRQLLRL